jgi:hypothetical protein
MRHLGHDKLTDPREEPPKSYVMLVTQVLFNIDVQWPMSGWELEKSIWRDGSKQMRNWRHSCLRKSDKGTRTLQHQSRLGMSVYFPEL